MLEVKGIRASSVAAIIQAAITDLAKACSPVWIIGIINVRNLLTVSVTNDVVVRLQFGRLGRREQPRLSSSNVRFIEPVFGRSVGARSFDLDAFALVVANRNPNGL